MWIRSRSYKRITAQKPLLSYLILRIKFAITKGHKLNAHVCAELCQALEMLPRMTHCYG